MKILHSKTLFETYLAMAYLLNEAPGEVLKQVDIADFLSKPKSSISEQIKILEEHSLVVSLVGDRAGAGLVDLYLEYLYEEHGNWLSSLNEMGADVLAALEENASAINQEFTRNSFRDSIKVNPPAHTMLDRYLMYVASGIFSNDYSQKTVSAAALKNMTFSKFFEFIANTAYTSGYLTEETREQINKINQSRDRSGVVADFETLISMAHLIHLNPLRTRISSQVTLDIAEVFRDH